MSNETVSEPAASVPPTGGRSADELLAELTAVRRELSDEKLALRAEREAVAGLRDAVVAQVQRQPAQPEPAPDLPADEDFDTDRVGSTARVAAEVFKRGLTQYDSTMREELKQLRSAQLDTEWERVKAEDPKNFGRLEKGMRDYLAKAEYQPGMVRNLFYRMRGEYMPRLQEMDQAERAREPVAAPNSASSTKKPVESYDTLDADEIRTIRGLGISAESYVGLKHQKEAKFEKGYLASVGLKEATK